MNSSFISVNSVMRIALLMICLEMSPLKNEQSESLFKIILMLCVQEREQVKPAKDLGPGKSLF